MLRLTIVLCIATAVVYGATQLVSKRYGDKVRARFLERNPTYTAESLSAWVQSNPQAAAGYVFPVLFPLDLLFMAFLAAFLAVASLGLAGTVDRLAGVAWLFALLPILYLAADLAEDTMLTRFLLAPNTITAAIVTTVQMLTRIKIWTLSISAVQVVFLGFCSIC